MTWAITANGTPEQVRAQVAQQQENFKTQAAQRADLELRGSELELKEQVVAMINTVLDHHEDDSQIGIRASGSSWLVTPPALTEEEIAAKKELASPKVGLSLHFDMTCGVAMVSGAKVETSSSNNTQQ